MLCTHLVSVVSCAYHVRTLAEDLLIILEHRTKTLSRFIGCMLSKVSQEVANEMAMFFSRKCF